MYTEQQDNFIAKTFFGLESVLFNELKELGASNVCISNRAVTFSGNKEMLYKANFYLRTAISILKPIVTFKASNEEELYAQVKKVDWEKYFTLKQTFAIEPTVYSPIFKHAQYASLKTKDAIVDQFRERSGKRPFVDPENPDVLINLHISDTSCTLSLNSSGEPLFKRGYRSATQEAPINEVLAAGLILLSGWSPDRNFIDPMCGSGTLLIEAALIANKIPPGIFRRHFGFENWPDFDNEIFNKISSEDEDVKKHTLPKGKILGLDISAKAISVARNNINNASLQNAIELDVCDFIDYLPVFDSGVIITNPPYGERLKNDNIILLYEAMGDTLKKKYKNFDAWIISSNIDAVKSIGLHPSKKIKLKNAALDCTFNQYQIYEGSKKIKNDDEKKNNFF
jgi:putative N6-adenine-specific DNA methylase